MFKHNPRKWNLSDPVERAKAAKHYERQYRKHYRRLIFKRFFNEPHFAFVDMLLLGLTAALLGAGWVWIVDRL